MKIQYLSHSSFLIETKGYTILIDPFFTGNPKAESINANELNPDWILVSHGHGDHLADVESIAKRTGAKVISNFEIVSWYGEKGIEGHPLNHGGKATFDFGTVKYVNAIHTSSLPDGSNGGDPGGFVVWNDECCFYFAGDTALTLDMKLIPATCPKLDIAILPIGDNFTMGYEDAAIASEFIECDRIIGCHFDTFGYIEIDSDKAKNTFNEKGKELILMEIGTTLEL
ncbi:MAG: metal-dependent hydrolase [Bacteroidia bacterium]|nr:metal-dependent hydrolase [Bacteroidia bacterium]